MPFNSLDFISYSHCHLLPTEYHDRKSVFLILMFEGPTRLKREGKGQLGLS